jgi:hypothetical protein
VNVLLKNGLVVLLAEHEDDATDLSEWLAAHADHAFRTPRTRQHTFVGRGCSDALPNASLRE